MDRCLFATNFGTEDEFLAVDECRLGIYVCFAGVCADPLRAYTAGAFSPPKAPDAPQTPEFAPWGLPAVGPLLCQQ